MISITLFRNRESYRGFKVTGHAGYANPGEDIICASVTSAVQLVANGLSECTGSKADVKVLENEVSVCVPNKECSDTTIQAFLQAFYLHMTLLEEDYNDYITVTIVEV